MNLHIRLFWLQVFLFPLQVSGRSGLCDEPDPAFSVDHLPFLIGVIEFDVAGAVDFQPANFVERNGLGPETKGCAVRVELDAGVHFRWMVDG